MKIGTRILPPSDVPDADRYTFGPRSYWRWRADGTGLRPETLRDRWTTALAEVFWPRRSVVVTSIDRERGTITLGDT